MAVNPIRPTDDDARLLGRTLLRTARVASLGSLSPTEGYPSVSLASLATEFDGTPVILVSRLSGHTENLLADARASLLVGQTGRGDPLAHPRMTIFAKAAFIDRSDAERSGMRRRFLAHNPKAALYVDFPDFSFVRLEILRASLNGGFGRAYELTPADLLSETGDAAALAEAEESAIDHMNRDHAEAASLYATRLCGLPTARWRVSSIDPGGMVLQAGERTARVPFDERVTTPGALRLALKRLADRARSISTKSDP